MANLHLVTGYQGQSHVAAEDHGSLNAAIVGSGNYVLNRGFQFAATVISNNTIRISGGDLLIQGRHTRLAGGAFVDLAIDNGTQGNGRNDLIVCRYTKNATTGVEECNLVVIKGTETTGTAVDPDYSAGDILDSADAQVDFPLWRIPLDGLTVGTPVQLFKVVNPINASNSQYTVLVEGVDFGDELPAEAPLGRLFFKKVT